MQIDVRGVVFAMFADQHAMQRLKSMRLIEIRGFTHFGGVGMLLFNENDTDWFWTGQTYWLELLESECGGIISRVPMSGCMHGWRAACLEEGMSRRVRSEDLTKSEGIFLKGREDDSTQWARGLEREPGTDSDFPDKPRPCKESNRLINYSKLSFDDSL
jgi:hypothetical protein